MEYGIKGIDMQVGDRGRSFGLRFVILRLLSKKEMTGAMIIDSISKMSLGYWKPSPGSIYPMLNLVSKAGYLKVRVQDGKKFYSLTPRARDFYESICPPPFMASLKPDREDSIEESIESIASGISYLADNRELLKKDRKSTSRLRGIAARLRSIL